MTFKISDHARQEMQRRGISEEILQLVIDHPEQVVPNQETRKAYQSKVEIGGKIYLLRVIVDESASVVITVYRTSKIEKYWSES